MREGRNQEVNTSGESPGQEAIGSNGGTLGIRNPPRSEWRTSKSSMERGALHPARAHGGGSAFLLPLPRRLFVGLTRT